MWPFNKSPGWSGGGRTSLGGQITNFADLEEVVEGVLCAYRAALESVANHTPRMANEQSGGLRRNLRQIRARLDSQPSVAVLKETAKEVDRELANWSRATEASLEAQEKEAKEAMAAIAVMAEALGSTEKTYGVRFRGISKKLRVLTTSNDIAEIRKKLQAEIELLEQYVDRMTQENESALGRLRDLESARRARAEADKETAADRESEEHRKPLVEAIRTQVKTGDRVAIIRVTAPADVASKGSALILARMRDVFESSALTGQWNAHNFIAICYLPLPEAAARLEIMERDLSAKLGVKLESTVFEKTPGCNSTELLTRFLAIPKVAA
jgi:hypothetical protein